MLHEKQMGTWVVVPPCSLSPARESAEENAQRRGSEIAVMMYGYLVVTRSQDAHVQVMLWRRPTAVLARLPNAVELKSKSVSLQAVHRSTTVTVTLLPLSGIEMENV